MDCPRAFTARFMASVWALFAVVFLAIYTANLAAFMITREEWDHFKGIDDTRLNNPLSVKPPLRFGTVPWTYTEAALRRHYPNMHLYMKPFNKENVMEGVAAVKAGELDAFIYDGTVLEYLVGQDDECRLLTVGNWYAMTGYGVAFPRNSKHFSNFNRKVMDYSENGDLERLRRFWLTGTCRPRKQEKRSSEPLAPEQFLSAFFLLLCGVCLAAGLCSLEYVYCQYLRPAKPKSDMPGCCSLISMSVGKSLTYRSTGSDYIMNNHSCSDPACYTQLTQVQRELEQARQELTHLQEELVSHGLTDQLLLLIPAATAAATTSCQLPASEQGNLSSCNTVDLVCSTDSARLSMDGSLVGGFHDISHVEEEDSSAGQPDHHQRTVTREFSEIETVL